MWKGNPILTTVIFGLPAGFLSLICYGICCPDILDAEEEEEGNFIKDFLLCVSKIKFPSDKQLTKILCFRGRRKKSYKERLSGEVKKMLIS